MILSRLFFSAACEQAEAAGQPAARPQGHSLCLKLIWAFRLRTSRALMSACAVVRTEPWERPWGRGEGTHLAFESRLSCSGAGDRQPLPTRASDTDSVFQGEAGAQMLRVSRVSRTALGAHFVGEIAVEK